MSRLSMARKPMGIKVNSYSSTLRGAFILYTLNNEKQGIRKYC